MDTNNWNKSQIRIKMSLGFLMTLLERNVFPNTASGLRKIGPTLHDISRLCS